MTGVVNIPTIRKEVTTIERIKWEDCLNVINVNFSNCVIVGKSSDSDQPNDFVLESRAEKEGIPFWGYS